LRGRSVFLAAVLTASVVALGAAAAPEPEQAPPSCKPGAPIQIRLRPVEVRPGAGLYRVAVEVRLEAELAELSMSLELPRGGRLLRDGSLSPRRVGQRLDEELALGTAPGQGVEAIVSVQGSLGGAVLRKSAAISLGPLEAQRLAGRERTDEQGRSFLEVSAGAARGER
jgi:hypothetical protein